MPIGAVALIVFGAFIGINLWISHEEMKDIEIPKVQSSIHEVASAKADSSVPYEYGAGKPSQEPERQPEPPEPATITVREAVDSPAPAVHPLSDDSGRVPPVGEAWPDKPEISR